MHRDIFKYLSMLCRKKKTLIISVSDFFFFLQKKEFIPIDVIELAVL